VMQNARSHSDRAGHGRRNLPSADPTTETEGAPQSHSYVGPLNPIDALKNTRP
jgi:hypothetical protein